MVDSTQSMRQIVEQLRQHYLALWWSSPTTAPDLPRRFTPAEQQAREGHLEQFLGTVLREVRDPPKGLEERRALQHRALARFAEFAKAGLDWEQRHLDVVLANGFTEVATEFAQLARRFDPTIGGESIFQASRNAWVMNGLQVLLGLPCRLTPSVFAYSMLYPYTDNYLDDPNVPGETKRAFNERFERRIRGEALTPQNTQESRIGELVRMVEGEWDRQSYPSVYDSLLAIHHAQVRSVELVRGDAAPYEVDVLGISLEKGGTSVLADGYLVAGTLTSEQQGFLYGWGALLQFLDDLQDVAKDAEAGLQTVFSQTGRHWPLDATTSRCLHFGQAVLQGLRWFEAEGAGPLKELMVSTAGMMWVNAVGNAPNVHSRGFVRDLESHSPFRFARLARARETLSTQRISFLGMVEAFARQSPDAAPSWLGRS